jgi:hypothetical protein
MMVELSVKE